MFDGTFGFWTLSLATSSNAPFVLFAANASHFTRYTPHFPGTPFHAISFRNPKSAIKK
jgi:hypothetical protein